MNKITLPNGWKNVKLGDVCEIIMGQSPSSEFYNICNVGIPLIQGNADIENRKTIIRIFTSQITKIAQKGDIIMSVRAPVGEIATTAFDCCIGRGVCAIRGNRYIYYYLEFFESKWYRLSQGTTFDSITGEQLYNFSIPLPPLSEQRAIAEILTTADKLITTKERLVVAKQKQKQWLMQNLLTGKIRLPGFSEKWGKKALQDCGTIITGFTPSTIEKGNFGNDFLWVTPTDIDGSVYIHNTERRLSKKGMTKCRMIKAGSILVTCIASIGKNVILPEDGSCNQQINAITPNQKYNVEYLYYLICFNKSKLNKYAGKTATPIINKETFQNIVFHFPPLPEQQAIASILTTADREIELLKKELEQQKQVKKYLMQNLLTGKIRVKEAEV